MWLSESVQRRVGKGCTDGLSCLRPLQSACACMQIDSGRLELLVGVACSGKMRPRLCSMSSDGLVKDNCLVTRCAAALLHMMCYLHALSQNCESTHAGCATHGVNGCAAVTA